ncbi:MAG TPA: hypothetical protein VEK07_24880 [Polyangiaceae bacterium]|nr:hypothetical protein [Polyangiaceae bacterium]
MRTVGVIALAIAGFVPAAARAQPARAQSADLAEAHAASADLGGAGAADSSARAASTDVGAHTASNDRVAGGAQSAADAVQSGSVRPSDRVRADVLFRVAQELRAAGLYADACPKFAQTQRLVPGIGVTLYLADCYEHLGRPAWAWSEFRKAERLALQRKDSRASVARSRAAALEPKLKRVTISVSKPTQQDGLEVTFDGASVPPDRWNVALAADPGDHLLGFRVRGGDLRTIRVRIDPNAPPLTVPVDEPLAPAASSSGPQATTPHPPIPAARPVGMPAPPTAAPPAAQAAAPPSTVPSPTTALPLAADAGTGSGLSSATRVTLELGLVAGGVAAVALGAGFLAIRNHAIETDQASSAGAVSAAAFGVGAAALVSSVVLYLTAPSDKSSAVVVSAVPLVAGAGAMVGGHF